MIVPESFLLGMFHAIGREESPNKQLWSTDSLTNWHRSSLRNETEDTGLLNLHSENLPQESKSLALSKGKRQREKGEYMLRCSQS